MWPNPDIGLSDFAREVGAGLGAASELDQLKLRKAGINLAVSGSSIRRFCRKEFSGHSGKPSSHERSSQDAERNQQRALL